jgi:plastocyanin
MSRSLLVVFAVTLTLLLGACGGDSQRLGADITTPPTIATTRVRATTPTTTASKMTSTTGGAVAPRFTVVARNIAFVPSNIGPVKASDEVEITFDNQDANVPHNLHFAAPIDQKTDVKTGPAKDTLKFTIAKAGTYDFSCDVHPTMKGELTVQ